MADAFRNEIKRYIKRESNKKLPEGFDYWDFDCRLGIDDSNAKEIAVPSIGGAIESIVQNGDESFYMEILSKPCKRVHKPRKIYKSDDDSDDSEVENSEIY